MTIAQRVRDLAAEGLAVAEMAILRNAMEDAQQNVAPALGSDIGRRLSVTPALDPERCPFAKNGRRAEIDMAGGWIVDQSAACLIALRTDTTRHPPRVES